MSVYGERSGLDRETALRIAGAFGAGLARTGQTCGAVTGALMVIGLHHAKLKKGDDDGRERAYALAQEFMDAFKARNRSLVCNELLGVDVSMVEGMKAVREKDLFRTVCPKFVRDAGEVLEELV
ncbi:MAG: C-GCAxxG-C-C family protein [Nitrospirota bacterium]|nr:C-GCAxxG-C-C family protein [Nitrospirota bacterium]